MSNEYIAIDFETTGLDSKNSEIVEIGAVRFREDGEILDTFQSLARPSHGIPKEAQQIHGITDLMVQEMDPPHVVWDRFLDWAGEFTALVAHNAQFEALFIQEIYSNGQTPPDIKVIDTLRLSRNRMKDLQSYKLSDLVESLGDDGHRALPDAQACVEVFLKSASTYKSGKVPNGTYLAPVSSYQYIDPSAPTAKQLAYIESLGGNSAEISTKREASQYIDRLKAGERRTGKGNKPEKAFFDTIIGQVAKVLLTLIAIVFGWIWLLS